MSVTDVQSSSLLSPHVAPTELAEERSALSQQYSDTVSNVQDQENGKNPDGSSLRPLRQSANDNQGDHHESSIEPEAVFIDSMLISLKHLRDSDLLRDTNNRYLLK